MNTACLVNRTNPDMIAICDLSEREFWSGLDRNDPGLESHLERCPTCKVRAEVLKRGIDGVVGALAAAQPSLPKMIGSYRILRRLGQGGMGIVYEGEQSTPRRLVAIKVVRGGQFVDDYRVRLFQREAETLARLRHPGIASIYEAGRTEDGQHFFAMELVQGLPLGDFIASHAVPIRARLELFCRICDAINYAHQRGVIHRDLKPSNIVVDQEGTPKILDFGLARITDPDAAVAASGTDIGRIMGTLSYMSPEEARGSADEIDIRSDVYALGVVFFEMLTGTLPYRVSSTALHEAVRIICEEPPRRPSTIQRATRGDLETISLTALQKEPSRRYQTAAAFAEDVRRFLHDEPVWARRAGVLYRFRKLLVRHKGLVALASVVLVVLAAGWIWILQAERQMGDAVRYRESQAELIIARTRLDAAQARHELGLLDHRTEAYYRDALESFSRAGYNDVKVAQAKLGLATLLLSRPEVSDVDLQVTDALLQDAAAIFTWSGPDWEPGLQQTLSVQGNLERMREQRRTVHLEVPRNAERSDGEGAFP